MFNIAFVFYYRIYRKYKFVYELLHYTSNQYNEMRYPVANCYNRVAFTTRVEKTE